ncbi:phospholipase effector Tle1 domain-containing protein [Moraxella bovis]|uniref:Uncharacterized conserved protein n=1 Tax=Moraxella bovis TaxID=476 RepID=A0A378PR28_MORBO|nr:DUF2235 domain-containing protein [Moraxella bovis]STY90985.1 Uncharacterized conserved protein [Moraxella bovis]
MGTTTGKPTKPSKSTGKALKPTTNLSNTTQGSQVQAKIHDIVTVNLFFDGTKNNYYNIRNRANFSRETLYKSKDYESYLNNYSNVANLYRFINQKKVSDSTLNIYIEGIGTENAVLNQNNQLVSSGKADSTQGFAYGSGSTGVKTRAKEACEKIVEMAKAKKIRANHLRINLFGFSRGAATARHFMHLIKTKPGSLSGWNLKAHQIRFGFVGLFDTVSSFHDFDWKSVAKRGGGGVANPNFNDDVGELGLDFRALDANDKKITKIIHIIAMDEYRNYFSVTNINSAIVGKYGIEILLNGAHSDIGGGYHNNTSDFYEIDGNNTELKQWFIDKGYYKKDQIIPIERKVLSNYFRLSRSGIKHDIYKITLQIMLKFAQSPKYAGLTFNNMGDNIKPDTFITDLMGKFPQQVFDFAEKGNWGKYQNLQLKEGSDNLKTLRNKYVHWSAKYIKWGSDNAGGESAMDEIGYEARLENGVPKREPISG